MYENEKKRPKLGLMVVLSLPIIISIMGLIDITGTLAILVFSMTTSFIMDRAQTQT